MRQTGKDKFQAVGLAPEGWLKAGKRLVHTLTGLWAVLVLAGGGRAMAAPQLTWQDLVLPARPDRVERIQWGAISAMMVLTNPEGNLAEGRVPVRQLSVYTLKEKGLHQAAHWSLPAAVRWIEPLTLPGGGKGWLALSGNRWLIAPETQGHLAWRTACTCATVFSVGKSPLYLNDPLARDIDGDGLPEVLLPGWNGLVIYRVQPGSLTLKPLWRDAWVPGESFSSGKRGLEADFDFPRYTLQDMNKDGVLDLVQILRNVLLVTQHPPAWAKNGPAGGPYYAIESSRLADMDAMGLPNNLQVALLKLNNTGYSGREAFLQSLYQQIPASGWGSHLNKVIQTAQESMPVIFAEGVSLPGLKALEKGESQDVLAIRDMNGDGSVDVLYQRSSEEGDAFNQKNQLRFYWGEPNGSALVRFTQTPQVFFSEGLNFTYLVEPSVTKNHTPGLFNATMEVSLGALISYFATHRVTIDAHYSPWEGTKLKEPAPVHGKIVFKADFSRDGTRPTILLADINGDGVREFLFNITPETLSAYPTTETGPNLDSPMAEGKTPLPRHQENSYVADLNGDKREELVLWFGSGLYGEKMARTLRVIQLTDKP